MMARRNDQQDTSTERRIRKLEDDLREVRTDLANLSRDNMRVASDTGVRLGITVADADVLYPLPSPLTGAGVVPNTYAVQLVDGDFDITEMLSVTTRQGRSTSTLTQRGTQIWAHNLIGGYIPEGRPVFVTRQQGLATGANSKRWWIVSGQHLTFFGKVVLFGGQEVVELYWPSPSDRLVDAYVKTINQSEASVGDEVIVVWTGDPKYPPNAQQVWSLAHVY